MDAVLPDLDAFERLNERRASHRSFTDQPIERALLERIIGAATRAPSGHNGQPWFFVVEERAAGVAALAGAVHARISAMVSALPQGEADKLEAFRFYATHFERAPVVVAVFQTDTNYLVKELQGQFPTVVTHEVAVAMEQQSIGAAIQNLLLAAAAAGLGACWMTAPVALAQTQLEALLTPPEGHRLVALIPIGHPTKTRRAAPKREWSASVRFAASASTEVQR